MAKLKFSRPKRGQVVTSILVVLALAGFAAAGYMYSQYNTLKNDPQASQKAQADKTNALKEKIGKLISVPKDETPTLATVTDKTKLKDQPFFKDAENGDVILIFPQAKKAIIYREKDNKLINVGPIAITTDTAAQKQSESQPAKTETQTQTRTTR